MQDPEIQAVLATSYKTKKKKAKKAKVTDAAMEEAA